MFRSSRARTAPGSAPTKLGSRPRASSRYRCRQRSHRAWTERSTEPEPKSATSGPREWFERLAGADLVAVRLGRQLDADCYPAEPGAERATRVHDQRRAHVAAFGGDARHFARRQLDRVDPTERVNVDAERTRAFGIAPHEWPRKHHGVIGIKAGGEHRRAWSSCGTMRSASAASISRVSSPSRRCSSTLCARPCGALFDRAPRTNSRLA